MNLRVSVSLVALVLAVGCEKSGPSAPKGSGSLAANETELLSSLPGGNTLLFGGNYMKFQKYLQSSPLGSMISMMDKSAPGIAEWTNCWADLPNVTMMGAVKIADRAVDMRFVMKGVDLPALESCAQKASYPTAVDPDKKFISLEMKNINGPMKMGYLVLPNGALYTKQAMSMANPGVIAGITRADLEAEVALIAKGNATTDTALISLMSSVDRTRAMWFVASAANTPVADKLGTVFGTVDIAPGLRLDVTAQIKDSAIADKITEAVPEMKKQAKALGPDLAAVVEGLQFTRSGDKLRFALTISDAQLTKIMEQLGPMMGGMGR